MRLKGDRVVRNSKHALLAAAFAIVGAGVLSVGISEPAEAKMTCKNVGTRWQVCGEVKPWTKFVAGVGIRFNKQGQQIRSR
jgi:hypothetical protein